MNIQLEMVDPRFSVTTGPMQDILGMQSVSLFVCSAQHPQIAGSTQLGGGLLCSYISVFV